MLGPRGAGLNRFGSFPPWFVITDLAPGESASAWYRLRAWCAQGFTCTKRGRWQWQLTQMTDPDRAARLWLALALAMCWMVRSGTDREVAPATTAPNLPDLRPFLSGVRRGAIRHLRVFRHEPLPLPSQWVPEPWPSTIVKQGQLLPP